MVLGDVEETITVVDVNDETLEEVIRVSRFFPVPRMPPQENVSQLEDTRLDKEEYQCDSLRITFAGTISLSIVVLLFSVAGEAPLRKTSYAHERRSWN